MRRNCFRRILCFISRQLTLSCGSLLYILPDHSCPGHLWEAAVVWAPATLRLISVCIGQITRYRCTIQHILYISEALRLPGYPLAQCHHLDYRRRHSLSNRLAKVSHIIIGRLRSLMCVSGGLRRLRVYCCHRMLWRAHPSSRIRMFLDPQRFGYF